MTVPIGISLLMGQHAFEWNEMMAMSVLGALPLLVLYPVPPDGVEPAARARISVTIGPENAPA